MKLRMIALFFVLLFIVFFYQEPTRPYEILRRKLSMISPRLHSLPLSLFFGKGADANPIEQEEKDIPSSIDVVTLTTANFLENISDGRIWFVEFYVPWCRGCKRVAKTWDELAEKMRPYHNDTVIARLNCLGDEIFCEALSVEKTPSLKLFRNGKEIMSYESSIIHIEMLYPFLHGKRLDILELNAKVPDKRKEEL